MSASPHIDPIIRRFIEDAGNTSQSLGAGRVIGQIYAYLYFSQEPRCLGDMQTALGISKGSASMSVRQLEQWGAARRVWVHGDRKDYYEANDWFGKIIKNMLTEAVGTKLGALQHSLDLAEKELQDVEGNGELTFVRDRVNRLRQFQNKAAKVWKNPVLQRLLR
jgi:DNA-binding transcriptional regulator GbsR (MarR family)